MNVHKKQSLLVLVLVVQVFDSETIMKEVVCAMLLSLGI